MWVGGGGGGGEGGGGGSRGEGGVGCVSESPIFVILCVLCFQTQSFLTFDTDGR